MMDAHGPLELDLQLDGASRRTDAPIGLTDEHEQLGRLFRAAEGGEGQAIVIRGEAGSGKTTLLDRAVRSTSGFGVAHVVGLESERDLAFAALHRLCGPMLDRLDRLPAPQRDALAAVFGVHAGGQVDLFIVALAVLGLFADASTDEPLLCAVDDADRLDEPSRRVLALVARRIGAERIALVFTVREPTDHLGGLPELIVRPLSDLDAHALLAAAVPGPLDEGVRDRIVAESRGNRRLLLAGPGMTPEQLAGGFCLPAPPTRVVPTLERLRDQVAALPCPTRRLLLVAAAEPQGDPGLVFGAGAALDVAPESADEATSRGLIHMGPRITFGHPLLRSVVYHDASLDERRRVHGVLADATEPDHPDRRAWHRAVATVTPDESVARALEQSATRAGERGGAVAAAAFLERAAVLTPDASARAQRALAAVRAKLDAGMPDAASELATMAGGGPLDGRDRGRLDLLAAQIAVARGRADAPRLVLDAARALEPLDARLARDGYLEAMEAAVLADNPGLARCVAAAVTTRAASPAGSPRAAEDLLDGFASWFTGGHDAAAATMRRAVDAAAGEVDPRVIGLAGRAAVELWDHEAAFALASRGVGLARRAGALTRLATALRELAGLHLHTGDFAAAARLVDEARTISIATGHRPTSPAAVMLAAWRGDEAAPAGVLEPARAGTPIGSAAAAVLHNGLARYDDALAAARRAWEGDEVVPSAVLPELIEAAARAGEPELAAAALEHLEARTQLAGTEWALGIEARSRAIISDGDAAEKHYRDAIDRLGRCGAAPDEARAHLLHGEWLRRQRRRVDARAELRTAQEMFAAMGAVAFAARAGHELLATGERARSRSVGRADDLTPREIQVAHLARAGESNPQIGARLFISARTVEYHLRKVFAKLGIESRRQLAYALS